MLYATSVTNKHIAASSASESRAPALHNGHIHAASFSYCTALAHPNLDLPFLFA